MTLRNYTVEQGFEIDGFGHFLSGSGAPTGTSGATDTAPKGSVYLDTSATGEVYHKKASTSSASDWERLVNESVYSALGIAFNAVDMGTFTGATISDNTDIKTALQELETAYEETDQNVDDLVTLSGVAENSTDLGTFTGATIPDNSDNKEAIQALETALEAVEGGSGTVDPIPAGTPTVVSTCLVDNCNGTEWEVCAYETASEGKKEAFKVQALHDGTSSSDAVDGNTDYETSQKKKIGGGIAGLTFTPKVELTGASQTIGLEISATAAITVKVRRTDIP